MNEQDLMDRAIRALLIGGIPTVAVALAGLAVSAVQGVMAIREESVSYAVRVATAVGVIVVFGASVSAALVELMRVALR